MNCKYCGAALPTTGGVCKECGRMIPIDQLREIKEQLDPNWNKYRNQDTAFYKKETAYDDNKTGKIAVLLILAVLILIIILIVKGMN